MLHLLGVENAIEGMHHPNIVDNKELIQFYINILRLFYASPEAEKWVAQKLKEDVGMIADYCEMTKTEAILWWCKSQWKLINQKYVDRYSVVEYFEDDFGVCERYLVWLEEKTE